jgi:ubiquinone/menaquinone biosynthesis C-methylase UbiE
VEQLLEATYRAEREHFWFKGFRQFVTPLVEQAVAGISAPRIVDCGCGTGANLSLLATYGAVCGFDLTALGLRYARQYGQHPVARASVAHIPLRSARFDLATSFDVLYCLQEDDERRAAAEMARILKPGGALIVNVAAMELLRGGHSVLAEEVRRYSRATLRRLLDAAGFDIVRLTYTNASLFPMMLAARLMQRAAGKSTKEETTAEITSPPKPVNAALTALLTLEAGAVRAVDMPFGSSLLCLARKRA